MEFNGGSQVYTHGNLFVQGGWTICASPPGVGGGSHGTPNVLTSESCGGGQT